MGEFITATQLEWQNKMVTNANPWMKIQQVEYCKLGHSDRMIRARLTALELALQEGYSIDSDNDVNMRTAPPLPLAIELPLPNTQLRLRLSCCIRKWHQF